MSAEAGPVVVAYDGSGPAEAAVRAAAALFPGRRLLVTTVWEPGLAMAIAPMRDVTGVGYAMPSADEMIAVDRAQHDHAVEAAEAGARLARELGATAEACPVEDEADAAETIAAIAANAGAGAVVVGSRGLGGVRSRLFGSTSRRLLEGAACPVLVVKAAD